MATVTGQSKVENEESVRCWKVERKYLRTVFTKTTNEFERENSEKEIDENKIRRLFKLITNKYDRIKVLDEQIKMKMYSDKDIDESEIEKELEVQETYRDKYMEAESSFEMLFNYNKDDMNKSTSSESGKLSTTSQSRTVLKLPKLELVQFNGDAKKWLGFWAQFQRLHNDEEISKEDKMQYLIQAMTPNSKARKLVESFPHSARGYEEALAHIKSRFAQEDMLIETYVRELINLMVNCVQQKSVRLTNLYDSLEGHLGALRSLGLTDDKFSLLLYPLVESCLPKEILVVWEREKVKLVKRNESNEAVNKLQVIMEFLRVEADGEERIQLAQSSFKFGETGKHNNTQVREKQEVPTASNLVSLTAGGKSCIFCSKSGHNSTECYQAQTMTLSERKEIVRKSGRCWACLGVNHQVKDCRSRVKCLLCKGRHCVLVCEKIPTEPMETENEFKGKNGVVNVSNMCQPYTGCVFLQTLVCYIQGKDRRIKARAMIDSGSQKCYITKDLAKRLNLSCKGEEKVSHQLFGGVKKETKHQIYKVEVQGLGRSFKYNMTVMDQEKICSNIPRVSDEKLKYELRQRGVWLSDISNPGEDDIQLLIGADMLPEIMLPNSIKIDKGLMALNTKLGWTLFGSYGELDDSSQHRTVSTCLNNVNCIADLWTLDTLGIKDPYEVKKKEEMQEEVMNKFKQEIRVNDENRYEVALPWTPHNLTLQDNRQMAVQRLNSLTKRLIKSNLFSEYHDILQDWVKQGIIEEVSHPESEISQYLPHHVVVKESSLTTRLRPVFNASVKNNDGYSLNDCLERGPNLIEIIPTIISRFRFGRIGVISDIKKAFLQISLQPADRRYLRFVWWENSELKRIITYQHCRVPFGVTSSPFLLGATLMYHLERQEQSLDTVQKLKKCMYVDNCLTAVDSVEELESFMKEASEIMSRGGFELRGWDFSFNKNSEQEEVQTLGLMWNINTDTLRVNLSVNEELHKGKLTKRKLLSAAQSIFDPVGFTTPVTLLPKLLLQRLWADKIGWDEELPQQMVSEFSRWAEQCKKLTMLEIPRCLFKQEAMTESSSLHMFADASKNAYAAAVFLRTKHMDSSVSVQLVQARARIAPLRSMTIPRLELMAAVIGTRIVHAVKESLNLVEGEVYYWSDSSVVLSWIKRRENWSVFVNNRVEEILKYSKASDWHHVPGHQNPADLLSRGCNVEILIKSKWWEGMDWLKKNNDTWPLEEQETDEREVEKEKRKTKSAVVNINCTVDGFSENLRYFSKYTRNVRLVAWMLRFGDNARKKDGRMKGNLTQQEIEEAENKLFCIIQRESIDKKDIMKGLESFVDEQGIVRLRSRLIHSNLDEEFKTPILLPDKHFIVSQMIEQVHVKLLHAGVNVVMNQLRDRFWIIRCRKTVREVVRKCVVCRRFTQKPTYVSLAPLPKDRVDAGNTFQVTGVDLAGPVYLKGQKQIKAWIVLFTCAVYRAVHLELVVSLSTDHFLMALRRFIARRGRPQIIYSDNGTNFVGLNNLMKQVEWDKIETFCEVEKISWKFNPPTAAWYGGWWERLIRIVKDLLKRQLGRACLSHEEMVTILCDCEAIVNSRPLTYVSDSFSDVKPLTPAMFLQTLDKSQVPDLDQIERNHLVQRHRYISEVRDALRQRFRSEYLGNLRHYHDQISGEIKVGSVVLVGSDQSKRIDWPLGKVLEIYPGSDGKCRVAKVRTTNGELIRPFQRLYLLEPSTSDHSSGTPDTNTRKDVLVDNISSQGERE